VPSLQEADISVPQAVAQVWHGLAGQCKEAIAKLRSELC
jgi:hypothetical protein